MKIYPGDIVYTTEGKGIVIPFEPINIIINDWYRRATMDEDYIGGFE